MSVEPSTARVLLAELAEALLPQRCIVCGRFGAALHPDCVATLARAEPPRCLRCWAPGRSVCARCKVEPPAFEALRTPFRFEGAARRAVLESKFMGITALLEPLTRAAADTVPPDWAVDAVVPVPLHRRRERQRGYNQATLIAEVVARRLGVRLRSEWLKRVRATPAQAGLRAEARRENLTRAFTAESSCAGARVLLVDDVTTTGATLEACAQALLDAGAAVTFGLAIARED
jgi:ComF family protein